ncbi:MAG: histidine phosphatase family protein [Synergistaceae bacterium]|jgi:phosphohistidine phosphatase|nr:histidine phosphatase family protein [Synergistaceae bacterium]
MRLILMRHASAVERPNARGERPLSEKGEHEADAAGFFLRMVGEVPDVIMHSSMLRSRVTAERVMAKVGQDGVLTKRGDLDEDSSAEEFLMSVAGEFGASNKKIMAVGHNPFMTDIALRVMTGSRSSPAIDRIDKASVFAVDCVSSALWIQRFYMPRALLLKVYDAWLAYSG